VSLHHGPSYLEAATVLSLATMGLDSATMGHASVSVSHFSVDMPYRYSEASRHHRTTHQPLHLNHVIHAPQIIKNLISMRQLTTDNNVSVFFDPFRFTIFDFQTGIPLMRSDSRGDLYQSLLPLILSFLRPFFGTVVLVIMAFMF
jgi:hypothetical protein